MTPLVRALAWSLLLNVIQHSAGQIAVCVVSITSPTPDTYSSTVDCTGDGSPPVPPVVLAHNATAINHTIIYKFNGEVEW